MSNKKKEFDDKDHKTNKRFIQQNIKQVDNMTYDDVNFALEEHA
jgi:hypothetical protein